jgi:hypothetical protein
LELKDSLNSGLDLSPKERARLARYHDNRVQSKPAKKFRKFLAQVDRSCCILCAIAFPQDRIYRTDDSVLKDLVKKTKDKPFELSESVQSLFRSSQVTQEHIRDSSDASKSEFVLEHPELEGVRRVFCHEMVEHIKTSQSGHEWKAVTMRFPIQPKEDSPFSCSLTLELHEEAMRELVLALFKMEAHWLSTTVQTLQVNHECGLVQTVPYLTQTGALCDKIADVFGEDIYLAVMNSAAYRKEQAEGKDRTKCVSVVWSKDERRVTLEMGIGKGVEISKKLFQMNVG